MSLVHIGPDDTLGNREMLNLVERLSKLEHSGRSSREEVPRIRVRLREDRRAVSDTVERKMIDRVNERVRAVAPVDAARVDERAVGVGAVGGLNALKTQDVGSDDRPGRQSSVRPVSKIGLVTVSRMMMGAADAGAVVAVPAEMASSAAAASPSASFFMTLSCSLIACGSERASRYGRSSSFTGP